MDIEKELEKLEALRKEILKQEEPETVDVEAKVQTGETEAKPLAAIQAVFSLEKGPQVSFSGNLMVAECLLRYALKYVEMAMQQHIIDNLPKEEGK